MAYIAYINTTIPIPNIADVTPEREQLGDRARTAGGTMRHDALDHSKRGWKLTCNYLTSTQWSVITDRLDTIYDGVDYFWINTLGGTPSTSTNINAFIDVEGDKWIQFYSSSGLVSEGHNVVLKITEQ